MAQDSSAQTFVETFVCPYVPDDNEAFVEFIEGFVKGFGEADAEKSRERGLGHGLGPCGWG